MRAAPSGACEHRDCRDSALHQRRSCRRLQSVPGPSPPVWTRDPETVHRGSFVLFRLVPYQGPLNFENNPMKRRALGAAPHSLTIDSLLQMRRVSIALYRDLRNRCADIAEIVPGQFYVPCAQILLQPMQLRGSGTRNDVAKVGPIELRVLVNRTGEKALSQRTERDKANSEFLKRRQNLVLRLSPPK